MGILMKIMNYVVRQFERSIVFEKQIESTEKLLQTTFCEDIKNKLSAVRSRKESVISLFASCKSKDAFLLLDGLVLDMTSLAFNISRDPYDCAAPDAIPEIDSIDDLELRAVLGKIAEITSGRARYSDISSVNRVSFFSRTLDYVLDLLESKYARRCGKTSSPVVRLFKSNACFYGQLVSVVAVTSLVVYWMIFFSSSIVSSHNEQRKIYQQTNFAANLLLDNIPPNSKVDGLAILEVDRRDGRTFCWAYGAQTVFTFNLPSQQQQHEYRLEFSAHNVIPDQAVDLYINGIKVASYDNLPKNEWLSETIQGDFIFKGQDGPNYIIFNYKDWNGHKTTFTTEDTRGFSLAFLKLKVRSQ